MGYHFIVCVSREREKIALHLLHTRPLEIKREMVAGATPVALEACSSVSYRVDPSVVVTQMGVLVVPNRLQNRLPATTYSFNEE